MNVFAQTPDDVKKAEQIAGRYGFCYQGIKNAEGEAPAGESFPAALVAGPEGLWLEGAQTRIRGDFLSLLPRIRKASLRSELLIRASGINKWNHKDRNARAIDATAGLGEDSFLLAAAGFSVTMCEKDPVIAALLQDALERAMADERLKNAAARMNLLTKDSICYMQNVWQEDEEVDIILLDPMFPERTKSALVKKKFQLLHLLEKPCDDEKDLLLAAGKVHPGRILIKRPAKGPWLAGVKPSFSLTGKAVRYDCLLPPYGV